MKTIFKKEKIIRIAALLIVFSVVLPQLFLPMKARAIFGIGDIVNDPVHIVTSVYGWLQDAYEFTQSSFILKTLTQAIKKRVLAMMSDQIIDWINNGKKPTFTQDFGSVFRDAGDAAVGDILQQYSATKALCEPFAFDITLQLQKPAPLADQVRCSLSSVIKNYNDYGKDFKNGGWLAYQELLKPQNNQWGAEIITQSEIINRTAQKTNESVLKTNVNVGFNSEECTGGWDLIDTRTNQIATKYPVTHFPPDKPRAPNDPPKQLLPPGDSNVALRCTSAMVTTPGGAIAEGLNKALYSNFDLTINDPDLTSALSNIIDAAFNKLVMKGVAGLKSFVSGTDTKSQADHSTDVQKAGKDFEDNANQVANNARNTNLNQLRSAAETLSSASLTLADASVKNQSIVSLANDLKSCSTGANTSSDSAFALSAINTANSTRQTLSVKSSQWNVASLNTSGLIARISSVSCDITCLNQNQRSVGDAVSAANSINIDASDILLGIESTLIDLQNRRKNSCGAQ